MRKLVGDAEGPDLEELLAVEEVSADQYVGVPGPGRDARLFGGQTLAQALAAAGATVPDGRRPHSIHAMLLRPGLSGVPLMHHVERVRDGREFTSRQVRVSQDGRLICTATTMWRATGVETDSFADVLGLRKRPEAGRALPFVGNGIVTTNLDLRWDEDDAGTTLWFRTARSSLTGRLAPFLLTSYVSDMWFAEPMARRLGSSFSSSDARLSTVSHSLWFHGTPRLDQWHALTSSSPVCDGGLGVVAGTLTTDAGSVVATVVQEALLRRRSGPRQVDKEPDATIQRTR